MASENKYEYMSDMSINDLLICKVCGNVLDDPISTPCQHVLCRQCIKRCLERTSFCPECRTPLLDSDLKPTERIIIRMLDQLKVKCTECGQINLERGNFKDHIEKTCMNSTMTCPAADINCPWKGLRDQLNDHKATCVFEPLRSMLSKIIDENRQLKEKVQQLEANNQSQRAVPTHANQRQTQLDATSTNLTNVTGKLDQSS
jgi:hypothetical protein